MPMKAILLLLSVTPLIATAEDLRDLSPGLAVDLENISGTVQVNGVQLALARAAGPGVPALAQRIIDRWRQDSDPAPLQMLGCCGWQLASRIHAGQSQVIQWRTVSGSSELLWSATDLAAATDAAPAISTPAVPKCRWSTPVHGTISGRAFLQSSARCDREPGPLMDLLVRRLASHGWHCSRSGNAVVHAERGEVQAQFVAVPSIRETGVPEPGWSGLVVVESRRVGSKRP